MGETVSGKTTPKTTPPGHELDASPWMRVESTLMATARLMREAYDAALHEVDLNLTEASLLAYVVESGPMKQTLIADHLGIGRAAAGNVIDRLQERSLVERRSDENDRRVWLVAATAAGKELAAEVTAVDIHLRQRLRLGIDRHERQMLASLLIRLQRNLVAANEPAANGNSSSPSEGSRSVLNQSPTTDRKHT